MKKPSFIKRWVGRCVLTTGTGSFFAGLVVIGFSDLTGIVLTASLIGAALTAITQYKKCFSNKHKVTSKDKALQAIATELKGIKYSLRIIMIATAFAVLAYILYLLKQELGLTVASDKLFLLIVSMVISAFVFFVLARILGPMTED